MSNDEIKELIQLVVESGIAELELERGGDRVRIRRTLSRGRRSLPAGSPAPSARNPPVDTAPTAPAPPPPVPHANEHIVKSPIVGTYYESPRAPAFRQSRRLSGPGQVLCIIESMKLMNEIESEIAGTIVAKLMESGRPWNTERPCSLFVRADMFQKILIANRGEIAVRVICACKDLGIKTVAVYSEADRNSLHVRFADEAICIGPAKSSRSYLDIPSVISAAEITNVDAIHPGYGFLSENADFAQVCEMSEIKFIGPKPDVTRAMGLKQHARAAMAECGVPILPGSTGILQNAEEALETAQRIGYPVMLKASAGGGGRGMRMVQEAAELPSLLTQAQQEAGAAFSSQDVYMEKLVVAPRHIEFQLLADEHGNVEILGERDCSIQRRHQKLLEEAPSPAMRAELRETMRERLCAAMKRIGYTNAGTIEFLMDRNGDLYFIEVNARIQVEHPVTESITGIDLVKSQILIAAGYKLPEIIQQPVEIRGHAIECRINAENPETFAPSPGRITAMNLPGDVGIRVDTAAYTDYVIPPFYDSLIAKLIAYGHDRNEAIARMRRALDMFVVEGIYTTIPLHQRIMNDPDFVAGNFDTSFLTTHTVKKAS